MDAGKLDTRIQIRRLTKTADTYGGYTSTTATASTVWAYKRETSGDISQENGKRRRELDIELVVRKKTADDILNTDLLKIENVSGEYRINGKFESGYKYFTTIKATKID